MLERAERLLERRLAVPLVDLVEVDVVGAQPAQARLARLDQVMTRQPRVVRAAAHRKPRLGRDQHTVAASLQRLADDLLRRARRVDVGRVDHVDAGVERHVDLPLGAGEVDLADAAELPAACEAHRPEDQLGDAQPRIAPTADSP